VIGQTGASFLSQECIRSFALSAGLVVVTQTDAESCRCCRWRVKRRIPVDLPLSLSFLKAGRWAGFSPRAIVNGDQMSSEYSRIAVTDYGGDVVVRFTSIPMPYDIASLLSAHQPVISPNSPPR
jgi:hypothetical protein